MNISVSIMDTIPFSGTLAITSVIFIIIGFAIVAGYIIVDFFQKRIEKQVILNKNPELEVFGTPNSDILKVNTGSILKSEGFSV